MISKLLSKPRMVLRFVGEMRLEPIKISKEDYCCLVATLGKVVTVLD